MSDAGVANFDHRAQVEVLLSSILRLMDYPAKLDFKDMSDGALGVAVHFEGELPGITPGKRSYLVDCLQFLLNKAINRPNVPKRWVNLGVNAFPELRGSSKPPEAARAPAPTSSDAPTRGSAHAGSSSSASATAGSAASAGATAPSAATTPRRDAKVKASEKAPAAHAPSHGAHHGGGHHGRGREVEDTSTVTEDPLWTKLGQDLVAKAQRHGRVYAVMMLSSEQRARLLKAAEGAKGVQTRAEGDGHWRRLTMTPEKLAPLPKKHIMPDWDDDEDDTPDNA